MSRWAGKTVIGLTGNIGTGKSVVRRMLEQLGALGIDADAISHQIIEKDSAGYLPVVEYFGRYILLPEGDIDRARLGRIVFSDPMAMQMLESIIHPKVTDAIHSLIETSTKPVIVIEAIKLFEAAIHQDCDATWVVRAAYPTQLERLVSRRKMTEADARQRIEAQDPQERKISLADVVIDNSGTVQQTWQQVVMAWRKMFPGDNRTFDFEASRFETEKSNCQVNGNK